MTAVTAKAACSPEEADPVFDHPLTEQLVRKVPSAWEKTGLDRDPSSGRAYLAGEVDRVTPLTERRCTERW